MRTPMTWLTISCLALALAACSADDGGNDSAADMAVGSAEEGAAPADAGGEAPQAEPGAPFGEGLNLADDDRSVITTGTVTLSAEDPVAAAADITALVGRLGGWVEAESLQAGSDTVDPRAHVVVRVPSRDVGTALGELAEVGKVETVDLERTDVTLQVRDLEARIRAVEMSVERMQDLLARATSTEDLVQAEQMLTERQSQLEQLLSQQLTMEDRVSMSTLTVDIVVPEEVPPPPPEPKEPRTGFLGGLQNGWEAFLDFGSGALLVLGALLPWLAFAAVVTVLVVWARRAYVRARPERPARGPRLGAPPAGYAYPQGPQGPPQQGWVQPGHAQPGQAQPGQAQQPPAGQASAPQPPAPQPPKPDADAPTSPPAPAGPPSAG